jgi:endonuclease G
LFKQIAFRDNQVRAVNGSTVQYLTDTDYGTSGSPVFDDYFNVIALHNQRVPDPNNPYRWYRNQGFRIEHILDDIGTEISIP